MYGMVAVKHTFGLQENGRGPDPGLLRAQARYSVCLLEIKHAAFSLTKKEPVQNH